MSDIAYQMGMLLLFDLIFVALLLIALLPLAIFRKAAFAVFKRNFSGYFSNPTGYVFLCVFVMLTSLATFWPNQFFISNLANLDQLTYWLPFIMLIYVPAITMSIWAEERRQGTDELLLTLPAGDFDIVMGKFVAAAGTFTVSMLFSQLTTFVVLDLLAIGDVDTGLFFTTYFGYWMIGLAMLAVGMVASFLTSNLTLGFILGLAFNAPLVFLVMVDVILPARWQPHLFSRWSFSDRFDDFGRGVVSLSGLSYFGLIIVLGIYLSIVLIGRRHWMGGRDGQSMLGHYFVRALALIGVLIFGNILFSNHDLIRKDFTQDQVSTLSPDTRKILGSLQNKYPVKIEAYLSARVPDEYVKTKYNLVSMLKELEHYAGGKVKVQLHDNLEEFSKETTLAEERYGIGRTPVRVQNRGEIRQEQIVLGAAFTCGVEKIVVPFFSNATPVEYELVRAIATVAQTDRKKLGVVTTEAQLNGGFSFAGGQPQQIPKAMVVEELGRQYQVEDVDIGAPFQVYAEDGKLRYDVLLVVQPSTLAPQQLNNLVLAIKEGQPTVIFEDPLPWVFQVVGTNEDKPAGGGFMGMGGAPPQPKGEAFKMIWDALDIEPIGEATIPGTLPGRVVCQSYLPYKRFGDIPAFGPFVFIRRNEAGEFNAQEKAVAGFEELIVPFTGGIREAQNPTSGRDLKFTELVNTAQTNTSTIDVENMRMFMRTGDEEVVRQKRDRTNKMYTLAAWIREDADASADDKSAKEDKEKKKDDKADHVAPAEGEADEVDSKGADKTKATDKAKEDEKKPDAGKDKKGTATKEKQKKHPLSVIYVADIDILHNELIALRNSGTGSEQFRWDNLPFVLNLIDAAADDDRYLNIRQRKTRYSTLHRVEAEANRAREKEDISAKDYQEKYDEAVKKEDEAVKKIEKEQQEFEADFEKKRNSGEPVNIGEYLQTAQTLKLRTMQALKNADDSKLELKRELAKNLESIRRDRDQQVRSVQNEFKLWSLVLPPIPPLLVGFIVWLQRYLREREGISRTRRKDS